MKILIFTLLALFAGLTTFAQDLILNSDIKPEEDKGGRGTDTTKLRYPIAKPTISSQNEIKQTSPIDIKEGNDFQTDVEYDPTTGLYIFHRRIGDMDITSPFAMSTSEYSDYQLKQSMNSYWAEKNRIGGGGGNKFGLDGVEIGLGVAGDKIFGPGGVKLKLQGTVELDFGLSFTKRDNPSIAERNRKVTNFDFDTKVQINASGTVGDRINVKFSYNTESTFDADQEMIKLSYQGKEDDIIRKIDVGNVSLPLSSTLIPGSNSLFGIMTELQYGKLKVSAVVSKQESESQTVSSKNGASTTEFEVDITDYDENKHYFLSRYFREHYDQWMKSVPLINSGIVITNIDVWVTNLNTYSSTQNTNNQSTRNIIAFTRMGESDNAESSDFQKDSNFPSNDLWSIYDQIKDKKHPLRTADMIEDVPELSLLKKDEDYAEIKSARKLTPSEYTLNENLGYISLRSALNNGEVLAVAYEYRMGGKTYRVGELSSNLSSSMESSTESISANDAPALYAKLIKTVEVDPNNEKIWDLMMKNVYNIGGYNIQEKDFDLQIKCLNSGGLYLDYAKEGEVRANYKNKKWINIIGADRLNSKQRKMTDGKFDFLEGYTVLASQGRIILPCVEPFGKTLDSVGAADLKFDKLYKNIKSDAYEYAENARFKIVGEYKSSSGNEIRIKPYAKKGSVKVTAGGRTLEEGSGYTVDYAAGIVRILDEAVLASNSQVNVTSESENMFSSQQTSLSGVNAEYKFSDRLSVGATIMHLSETPLTEKVANGSEPKSNTIWGVNAAYSDKSNWLTKVTDALPLVEAKAPSNFTLAGEFAQLIPGHNKHIEQDGESVSYIDDFEGTESSISLMSPTSWTLASVPMRTATPSLSKEFVRHNDKFWSSLDPDSSKYKNVEFGLNRAHFAWYQIDNIFQRNSGGNSSKPDGITLDDMSSNFTRQVVEQEIYPSKDEQNGVPTTISTLNIAYYPKERGMYNLDVDGMNANGELENPETRWGGMMRKLETTNFSKSNIEYLEIWMLDPYTEDGINMSANGVKNEGKLIFNLGEISEDILHDNEIEAEERFIPETDPNKVAETVWGRKPLGRATGKFDNDYIKYQDLGLNGKSSEQEREFDTYKKYLQGLAAKNVANYDAFEADPAGDDFEHYRKSNNSGILERYHRYNGMEGNTIIDESGDNKTAGSWVPNTEDINGDKTLNTREKYYEYVINITPEIFSADSSRWHESYIINRTKTPNEEQPDATLPNGQKKDVVWYRLKIPLQEADVNGANLSSKKGPSFTSIRYMRMYMTDFTETTYLRFAGINLTRTDWRTITNRGDKALFAGSDNKYSDNIKTNTDALQISSVSIEKDKQKKPVGYDTPPGIDRSHDPMSNVDRRENEQSMRMVVTGLKPKETAAAYKRTTLDVRQYKRLRMFVHFENEYEDPERSSNGVQFYVRIGSDYTDNYYEYKINNVIFTNAGEMSRQAIWPMEVDFAFDDLVNLKMERNRGSKAGSAFDPAMRFTKAYGDNELTVKGNPSFGDIRSILVGVINESGETKNMEIWLDEMRMTGFNEDGGWAALGKVGFTLSDFASFDATGRIETTGFGGIEANVMDRNMEDTYSLDMSATVQLGKLFPEKAHVNMPLTITHSREKEKPKYDPTNTDVLLKDALEDATESHKDSLEKMSVISSEQTSFALTNVRVGIASKKPMPYDPANFSFSLAFTKRNERDIDVEYDMTRTYRGNFNYSYTLSPKALSPFKNNKFFKTKKWKLFTDFGIYPMPNSYTFSVDMDRTYNEVLAREIGTGQPSISKQDRLSDMTWDKDFNITRRADIKWNFTKNLKISFATAMNSEIEETLAYNEDLLDLPRMREYKYNRDYIYDLREDSITQWSKDLRESTLKSVLAAGEPYNYSQQLNVSYAIPVNKISTFDWITANATYSGNYDWQRGVTLNPNTYTSNNDIADSKRSWTGDVRLNMETLYNKSNYLKDVNKKFSKATLAKKANEKLAERNDTTKKDEKVVEKPKAKEPKVYERKNLRLKKGNKTRISHRLAVNRIIVEAVDKDGKPYDLKYEVIDQNAINVIAKEDVNNITITVKEKMRKNEKLGNFLDGFVRSLMMVRNVSGNIRLTEGTTLNGYNRGSGFLGQAGSGEPGAKFTFGFYNAADAIEEAINKNQLGLKDVVNPIVLTHDQTLQAKAVLEPFTGIKFDLNAASSWNKGDEIFYFDGYEKGVEDLFSGSHSHTDIAIRRSSFKRGATTTSETFADFIDNVYKMRSHIERLYPDRGEAEVPLNSADVLVPAFVAAYKGENITKEQDTKIIRRIGKMLPNWKFSLDLLSKAPILKESFKAFNITHGYKCTYNINSFSKHNDWMSLTGDQEGFGILYDETEPTPFLVRSTKVDNVNLTEAFNPLVGINSTLKNSVRVKVEYNRNRTAGLDIPALQIVESYSKGFKIGGGYRIDKFGVIMGWVDKKKKTKVNNDLNLNLDIDFKNTEAFIRKFETINNTIEERSSGLQTMKAEFTAEYVVSQAMKVSFFYDRSASKPRVSTSYPITTSKFGIKIHLLLTETTSRDD
ncbi:MAG: cell surface protein SprA [Bacteroidales bacterium]|nr:cell surface protein SprA [Candidatus Scybalocola fimicaballi]